MPRMPSVPLISASPSFARSATGASPARGERRRRSATVAPSASHTSPSPISASAQWLSGARSPLAPSEPCSRTTGVRPWRSSASCRSTSCGSGARARHRQAARPQQQHRPHDLGLDRVAHARGVRAHQRELQLGGALGRDHGVGERAEAGGDAVHRVSLATNPSISAAERSISLAGARRRADTSAPRRATATTSSIRRPRPASSMLSFI